MSLDRRQQNLDRALTLLAAIIPAISYYLTLPNGIDLGLAGHFAAGTGGGSTPTAGILWNSVVQTSLTIFPSGPSQSLQITSLISVAGAGIFLYLITSRLIAHFSNGNHPGYAGGIIAALSFAWLQPLWSSATTIDPVGPGLLLGLAGLTFALRWHLASAPLWNLLLGITLILLGGLIAWPIFALLPTIALLLWFRANTGGEDPQLRPRYVAAGLGAAVGFLALWLVAGTLLSNDDTGRITAQEMEQVIAADGSTGPEESRDLIASIYKRKEVGFRSRVGYHFTGTLLRSLVGRISDDPAAPPLLFNLSEAERERYMLAPDAEERFPIRYFALPLLLALIGLVRHLRHEWRSGLLLATTFVAAGPLLVLFVSPAGLNVTGLFPLALFPVAVWIGFSAGGMIDGLQQSIREKSRENAEAAAERSINIRRGILFLVLLAGPVNLIYNGWNLQSRAGVSFSEDFAANMLASCEEHSLLFVEGSDLGGILQAQQKQNGVRDDVLVVELERLHDPLYQKRLAEHDLTIKSESQVGFDSVRAEISLIIEGDTTLWKPTGIATEGGRNYFTRAHRLLEEIVPNLLPTRPVAFAVTTDPIWWSGLDEYFVWTGLVYKVRPGESGERVSEAYSSYPIDREEMVARFETEEGEGSFRLGGLNDRSLLYRPSERRLVPAYRRAWLALAASEVDSAGDPGKRSAEVLTRMDQTIPLEVFPMSYWSAAATADLFRESRDEKMTERYARHAIARADAVGESWRTDLVAQNYNPHQITARMLVLLGDYEGAIARYRSLSSDPQKDPVIRGLIEELQIEEILARGDTAAAVSELDEIIRGYGGTESPGLGANLSAWEEYRSELAENDNN